VPQGRRGYIREKDCFRLAYLTAVEVNHALSRLKRKLAGSVGVMCRFG